MRIREEIEEIVAQLPNCPRFLYGRKTEINYMADDACFPAVVLIEPDDIGFILNPTTGTIRDTNVVFIQFVTQTYASAQIANDARSRETLTYDMRKLAAEFVNRVAASETLTISGTGETITIRGVPVIDGYDTNVVGIEIQLPITNTYPEDICI